jgi:hypothetical protein
MYQIANPPDGRALAPPPGPGYTSAMSDLLGDKAATKRRRESVESFLGALVKGARTVTLYKDGHSIIGEVTGRVNQLLKNAIGEEPNLWKPTEEVSLTDMQKELTTRKIDGLQIISILSFVVTGEQEEDTRNPGELSEEQIAAITAAETAPDFLYLVLKQAEVVNNKIAEDIVFAIDQVLNRDIPVEEFQDRMPWDSYDGRIRDHWDRLRSGFENPERLVRPALVGRLTLIDRESVEAIKNHSTHDAHASFRHALEHVHTVLENPVGEHQPKYALYAYSRLLEDLGRIGDLKPLLDEFDLWRKMAQDPKWGAYLATLKEQVQQKVPSPSLAGSIARKAVETDPEAAEGKALHDFALTVGPELMPLLLEEFRKTTGKEERQRFSKFLAPLYKRLGGKPLLDALKDSDYFFVIGVVGILVDLGVEDLAKHIGFLLDHDHEKVRSSVIQIFRRAPSATAAQELADFIADGKHDDQAQIAATTLSLIPVDGVDALLIGAYEKNEDYDVRLSIVTALGRHPGPRTAEFLKQVAHQTLKEWFFDLLARLKGSKESLRVVARKSLKQIAGEEKKDG